MNVDQWEWSSFVLVRSTFIKKTDLLDQVVHMSSPVIKLIESRTEQSIFVEIGSKFRPYFNDYPGQSIKLLNMMADHLQHTGCSLNIVFFFENFKNIFRSLAFLCFPSVSVCVHSLWAGRTPAMQQNWQSSEKSQKLRKKHNI